MTGTSTDRPAETAGAPTGPLFSVQGLRTSVRTSAGQLEILRGVDLEVERGETLAVVGESGSGKSFTALSVAGLLPDGAAVTAGRVLLEGRDLLTLSESERRAVRGAEIGMIYQDPMTSLNPVMRIGRQVTEGLRAHGWSAQDAQQRAVEVLGEVGLPSPTSLMRLYPHQLSGGMRQRVLIACALAPRPKVIIADEPTTALDVTIQQQILQLVGALRDEYGLAVIWITHDLGVVARIADRVSVMYAGRVAESADTRALFARPAHPYTEGLLRSLPTPADVHQAPLPQIGGAPISLSALPTGCPFAPRCSYKRGQCLEEEPALIDRARSRAACWVPPEEWAGLAAEETIDV
jgi:oligopeptide/dipeptide ABC transporter ATP-binding protein